MGGRRCTYVFRVRVWFIKRRKGKGVGFHWAWVVFNETWARDIFFWISDLFGPFVTYSMKPQGPNL